MSASNTNREQISNLPSASSAPPGPRRPITESDSIPLAPRFQRLGVESQIQLKVPQDCDATVIFKLVDRGPQGQDVYAFWLLVGRYGEGAMTVSYTSIDGDIRCDIPTGAAPLSSASLQPFLEEFLRDGNGLLEGDPPTLRP